MKSARSAARPSAAYLRLSVASDDSVSIAAQHRLVNDEAARRDWPAPVIFTDAGVSGSKDVRRPGRDELERRIAMGEFGALLVKSVDRLARSTADFARLAATCRANGCALVVVDLGLDTSTPHGELVAGVLAQLAQFEARLIGTRVATSNDERTRHGRALGGPIAYGFRNVKHADRDGKYRVVDAEQAATVRRMVDELNAGYSLHRIAQGLHRDGIPSPRHSNAVRAGRDPRDARGNLPSWTYGAVTRVLSNPALAGMQRRHGDLVRDPATGLPRVLDAAILTPEEWERVQDGLASRAASGDTSRMRLPVNARPLLDGLARCAGCGGRMTRSSARGAKLPDGTERERYYSYGCQRRPACPAPASIRGDALDAWAVAHFLAEAGPVEILRRVEGENAEHGATLRQLAAEIAATAERMTTAAPGDIPALAERMARLRQTQDETARLAAEAPSVTYEPTGQTYADAWEAAETDAARRDLLADAIEAVSVSKMRGRHPVAERAAIRWHAWVPRGLVDPDDLPAAEERSA